MKTLFHPASDFPPPKDGKEFIGLFYQGHKCKPSTRLCLWNESRNGFLTTQSDGCLPANDRRFVVTLRHERDLIMWADFPNEVQA
jgi:hypothetical protein